MANRYLHWKLKFRDMSSHNTPHKGPPCSAHHKISQTLHICYTTEPENLEILYISPFYATTDYKANISYTVIARETKLVESAKSIIQST